MTELANSPVELELRRLARLLAVDAQTLDGLDGLPLDDLRTLRDQITSALYDEHVESWERAVAVSGVVPSGLAAKLTEGALGPVLASRVVGVTPADKAVDIGNKLSPEFLADIAANMDPRKSTDVVRVMPPDRIATVSRVLATRGEYLVMADFVAVISDRALAATLEGLDDRAVLEVSVLLEDPDKINDVISTLDDARLAGLTATAEAEGMDAHLAVLRDALDETQTARLDDAG